MNRADVLAALRTILDPETGRDLMAMGLIYSVTVTGDDVQITMTTTTRGCPLAQMLRQGVNAALLKLPGVGHVTVDLTYDPPWTPDLMQG
jgi:metal-sulfur cluster biosynthetic enzyme